MAITPVLKDGTSKPPSSSSTPIFIVILHLYIFVLLLIIHRTRDDGCLEWEATIHNKPTYHAIADFILQHRPGEVVELHKSIMGGYNIHYRLEYKDGSSAALRIPCKGVCWASARPAPPHSDMEW